MCAYHCAQLLYTIQHRTVLRTQTKNNSLWRSVKPLLRQLLFTKVHTTVLACKFYVCSYTHNNEQQHWCFNALYKVNYNSVILSFTHYDARTLLILLPLLLPPLLYGRLITIMNLTDKLGIIYATACHASLCTTALDCLSISCHCRHTVLLLYTSMTRGGGGGD